MGSALISQSLLAANPTIVDSQAVTTTQTLDDNETGITELGGNLTVVVHGTLLDSSDVTITNGGTITVARHNLNLLVDLELGGDSNERFVNGQVRLDYAF